MAEETLEGGHMGPWWQPRWGLYHWFSFVCEAYFHFGGAYMHKKKKGVGYCIVVCHCCPLLSSHTVVRLSMLLLPAAFATNPRLMPASDLITSHYLPLLLLLLVGCCVFVCHPFLFSSCCCPSLTPSNGIIHRNRANDQPPLSPRFDCCICVSQLPCHLHTLPL
jgi:hypothetical protein